MIELLEEHRQALADLCHRHGVVRLEVFGSAATGEFDEARSDVDFIVEFTDGADLGPWLSEYFQLRSKLESLLGRKVDLVMAAAITDPYFKQAADRSRTTLYAA